VSALEEARQKYKSDIADMVMKCRDQVSEAQNQVSTSMVVLRR
jgi:hypothetical protein